MPHLLQFTSEHREEGLGLQNEVEEFEKEMEESVDEIWTRPAEEGNPDDWASRMASVERSRAVNPLDKVGKPDVIRGSDWSVKLLRC